VHARTVNLRQARKRKARENERAVADANAVRYGQLKAERIVGALERARAAAELDRHRLLNETKEHED